MDPEQLKQYKGRLEELASELRAQLQVNHEESDPVQLDTSIGRLSRMDAMQSQQMAKELQRRQQNQLQRVEAALKAVEKGTYGQCRKCGGTIAEERLEAMPEAVFCVACAGGASGR